ncbi:MAG: CotH kinase family protein [Cryomorphaceae bacterium]
MKSKIRLLSFICLATFSLQSTAQVVVNEFSASNYTGSGFTDNYAKYSDWVEFYNPTGADIDLAGHYLSDQEDDAMRWEFPAGSIVPANDFLVVFCSARDEFVDGFIHTEFKISQGKEEGVVFSDPAGNVIDIFILNDPCQVYHSRGKSTDGGADWALFTEATPGAPNADPKNYYAPLSIDTESGLYNGSASVTISSADPNVDIYYTLDGSEPTEASTAYNGPIGINETTVVRARGYSPNDNVPPSFIETNTYFINEDHGVYIVSVSGDELETLVNGQQIEPIGHLEIFSAEGELLAETGGDYNEHGNDSWAYDQRGLDYITQDEFGYGHELEYQIFRDKDRDEIQRLILKAGASDNYPFEPGGAHIRDAYVQSLSQVADLRMDERTYEPCVMYVNGQYWGVYEIREKVDDLDFTDHYYDQGQGQVDFLKTWGGTWEEYGSADEWDELRDYILGNDMTDDANYEYVSGLYNTGSLIDYFTLNSYIVCSDWLNWNTGWWRGKNPDGDKKKWRYILWDMDASFGHYVNFTGIPDQSANADLCDPEQLGDPGGQGHVPIWNALLENETFFAEYINRYSDLSGNYFSCDFMHAHLDSLVGLIEPEMQRHIDRWGGDMAEWQGNVQNIHDFIDTRCATVNDGVLDCYDQLDGPYEITLMANPPEGGRIDLPSMEIETYPFTTTYFGGIDVPFDADENDGYVFSHWTANNNVIDDDLSEEIVMNFTADDTLTAHFVAEEVFEVTLYVEPEETGTITIDGTTYDEFPVTIELTGSTPRDLSAEAIEGWEFDFWESDYALDEAPLINENGFSTDANGSITAHFFEVIYEVSFNVVPENAGGIDVMGDPLESLPQSLELPGNVPINISAYPKQEFMEFSHWSTLSNLPLPDEFAGDVEISFDSGDMVVANFIELPNFPVTIDAEPRDVGWVKLADTLLTEFPYQKQVPGNEYLDVEAIERGKYKFTHWEIVFGPPVNYEEIPFQRYFMSTPAHLVAHFTERYNNVFIPTSFTPNGDGVNDLLKVYAEEIELDNFRFSVLNRWGQEIWGTTDIEKGWNGAEEGSSYASPPGIYSYFLRYENSITGEIVEKAGVITLIR